MVTLLTDAGDLLTLRKAGTSNFFLQPFAKVEAAQDCAFCPNEGRVVLTLRFWHTQRLALARSLLRAQGWCKADDRCHVTPFRARRILIRDPLGQWETLTASVPLPGVLPSKKRVTILPTKRAANSSLTVGALTIFQLSIVDSPSTGQEDKQVLTITNEDLLWAQKVL